MRARRLRARPPRRASSRRAASPTPTAISGRPGFAEHPFGNRPRLQLLGTPLTYQLAGGA
eukprot:3886173-Pyramimonas_sp.AAC.1